MIAWQGNSEDISRYPKNTKIIEDSRQVKCFSNLTGNISFLLKCPFSLIQKKAIKDLIAIMRIDSTGSAGRMGQPEKKIMVVVLGPNNLEDREFYAFTWPP